MPDIETVVLVGSWTKQLGLNEDRINYPLVDAENHDRTRSGSRQVFMRSLARTLDKLDNLGVNVVIVGAAPGAPFDVPHILALAELNRVDRPANVNASDVRKVQGDADAVIRAVVRNHKNVRYVPIWDAFCSAKYCNLTVNNSPLYSDNGHLSGRGASQFLNPALIHRMNSALTSLDITQ